LESECAINWEATARSISLDRKLKLEIGRYELRSSGLRDVHSYHRHLLLLVITEADTRFAIARTVESRMRSRRNTIMVHDACPRPFIAVRCAM